MTKKIVFLELKTKRQAIILTISYIEYLQVLITTAVGNFLYLIVIFKLFKDNVRHWFDDAKEVQYLSKISFVEHTAWEQIRIKCRNYRSN